MAALACAGCANLMVPRTEIKGSIANQPWSLSSPKDSELTGLQITADTNGNVAINIQSLKARMNPEVIQMSGQVFVDSINAIGSQIQSAAASGAKAGAK